MAYTFQAIEFGVEVAKAAVSSGEKAGFEALNNPHEVAKLIEAVAKQVMDLSKAD
jgi:hypothetical protein